MDRANGMRMFRVGEFAKITGVSVRALHHYDTLGLLRPGGYSEGGHRLYAETHLLRLQQILTLRYLGFSLKQIRTLLDRPDFNLVASIQIQQRELHDRICELERIEAALQTLLDHRHATGEWSWELVAGASSAVQDSLSSIGAHMSDRFSPELMKQFEELGRKMGPEAIKAFEDQWSVLIADVRASRDLDPAGPEAQVLAERWRSYHARIADAYKEYPDLWQAIGENYKENRFADVELAPKPEDYAFIQLVNEAHPASGTD